ncbi:protein FAR1-related sequence 5 [Tanacetum coccineum]
MDSSHSSARSVVSHNSVSSDVAVGSSVPSGTVLNAFAEEIVAYENDSNETHAVKKLNALCTLESFITHSNFDTPGGTVYYIPKVSADVLLVKWTVYDSVEDCVVAYMKMGCPKGIHVDTLDLGNSDKQKRNSNLHITGCKARTVFNLDTYTRKFVLHVFDTIHNHELEREEYKHLLKTERQLTYMEQAFIVKAASVNIGATRAHHLLTAIDNHKKRVTVAAGLLKNETTKSYIWLLKAFIKAFGKAPSIVVTDQDGAMRNAIEAEFVGSKHQLCMWYITQKLHAKICAKIYDETDFKEKLNKFVWNMYIGPKEFEYKWGKLMKEFKLKNHKWLIKMFNIRSTWIPAYFIDSLLCGLMRTTSRSESKDKAEEDDIVDLFFKKDGLYKNANVEMIPQQYILRRWTTNLIPAALRNKRNKYGEKNVVVENFANEETWIVDHYVHLLSKYEPRLGAFVEKLKLLKK